jgi:hypothetical protein
MKRTKPDPIIRKIGWFEIMEGIKEAKKDMEELQINIERTFPGTMERIYRGAIRAVLFDWTPAKNGTVLKRIFLNCCAICMKIESNYY